MTIKYKNPPINELVVGVYFDRDVASLRSEYVGVFWNRYRRDFPTIAEQPLLTRPINLFVDLPLIEFSNMPRYWLESADGTNLIQIQRNAFLTNWRRRNADYPHFDAVKDFFDVTLLNFVAFLDEELHEPSPRIQLAELSYINLIEPNEYWSSQLDTPRVLPRFSLPVP
ncbi:MAG TPA: TIGR04255 family protein, partial [Roseiarcus sp.]